MHLSQSLLNPFSNEKVELGLKVVKNIIEGKRFFIFNVYPRWDKGTNIVRNLSNWCKTVFNESPICFSPEPYFTKSYVDSKFECIKIGMPLVGRHINIGIIDDPYSSTTGFKDLNLLSYRECFKIWFSDNYCSRLIPESLTFICYTDINNCNDNKIQYNKSLTDFLLNTLSKEETFYYEDLKSHLFNGNYAFV